MPALRTTVLARHLALAYLALVVYASLHPFTGWRDTGTAPFAFLGLAWPRYWTGFDLGVNVAGYLPLGFLLTLAQPEGRRRVLAVAIAAIAAGAVSFGLETVQNWLPTRVPSNLDLACNFAGAVCGALIAARQGPSVFARIGHWEQRMLAPVLRPEAGLTLLGLWLFAQLSPETVLFGTGDLRRLFGEFEAIPYSADHLLALETAIVACKMLAVGLFVRHLLAREVFALPPIFLFFMLAMAIRALATATVVGPPESFDWLTPGAARGLVAGGSALLVAALLPDWLRLALANLALLAGTVLVNLAPENPYRSAALMQWQQGHLLNFNGLTRLVSALWPFLALPYLTLLARCDPG